MRPTTNGPNGRDRRGRFTTGNAGGPGNPHAGQVGKWRAVLAETVTDDDMRDVVRVLIDKAKAGEPWAVRELLDRCLGKVTTTDEPRGEPTEVVVRYDVKVPTLTDSI